MTAGRPPVAGTALVLAAACWLSLVAGVLVWAGGSSGLAVVLVAFAVALLVSAGVATTRRTR